MVIILLEQNKLYSKAGRKTLKLTAPVQMRMCGQLLTVGHAGRRAGRKSLLLAPGSKPKQTAVLFLSQEKDASKRGLYSSKFAEKPLRVMQLCIPVIKENKRSLQTHYRFKVP